MDTTTTEIAPGISIKAGEASKKLHNELELYIAQRRMEGVELTKPRAVIEILNSALANIYPLSQPTNP